MKANEVLNLLRITRQTLTKYVKEGIIKTERLPNGRYEYDAESVYAFLNKDVKRKTYIYARVSTSKQKNDLKNQVELLKQFCFTNGYMVSGVYTDIASGISFEKLDSQEIFEEIISLLHCYSMKLYNKRKVQKIKEVLKNEDDE